MNRLTALLLALCVPTVMRSQATPDFVFASAAVRVIVARATVANHAPPPSLWGYRAHVESALTLRQRELDSRCFRELRTLVWLGRSTIPRRGTSSPE